MLGQWAVGLMSGRTNGQPLSLLECQCDSFIEKQVLQLLNSVNIATAAVQ